MKKILLILIIIPVLFFAFCQQMDESTGQLEASPDELVEVVGRLLTDAEMVNREDPNAADVKQEWADWIKTNVSPLRSLTHTDFPDLQFLKSLLQGRTIIQLGETAHGVKEFSQIKVRLIRFLHQEMGFDVIAFESCLFSCFYADKFYKDTATDLLTLAINSAWHCEEVLELIEYINETRGTVNPLKLAGLDLQGAIAFITKKRSAFLRDIIKKIDSTYADEVYSYDTTVLKNVREGNWGAQGAYYEEHKDEMKEFYGKLLTFIDENMDELLNALPKDQESVFIARQTVWSFIRSIDFQLALHQGNANDYINIRDRAMAENLAYLAEKAYSGKKIMVWAHNFHVQHRQADINPELKTMGGWVVERYRPKLYTVGLYMYRGKNFPVEPPNTNSLEAIGYQARLKFFFVDMLNQVQVPGNSWMFTEIDSKVGGSGQVFIVPRDQFDAILFIDTVSPQTYLARKEENTVGSDPCLTVRGK